MLEMPLKSKCAVIMEDPYGDPNGDTMQFRLTYEGLLLSNGHLQHKHEIRKKFHPQLRRLWEITPSLKEMRHPVMDLVEVNRGADKSRIEWLAEEHREHDYDLVPLITKDLEISYCGINILYLRRDPPGRVVQNADIDNRLKTLFDALTRPKGKAQLGGYDIPSDDEKPFYCLLEDDSLVTAISVETDYLLEPVGGKYDENDARLLITVNIQPNISRLDLRFHSVNFRG